VIEKAKCNIHSLAPPAADKAAITSGIGRLCTVLLDGMRKELE